MAYNQQINPWGGATSELGWRGFADGGRISSPGAIAPPKPTLLSDAALLGMSAVLEGDGDLFGPSATGKIVGGDAWKAVSSSMDTLRNRANDATLSKEDRLLAMKAYGAASDEKIRIKQSPGFGKSIYTKDTFEFGDAPKDGILSEDVDNRYMSDDSSWHKAKASKLAEVEAAEAKEKAFWEAQANPTGNYYEGDPLLKHFGRQQSMLDAQMRGLNNRPYVETTEVVPSEFFDKNRLEPRWKPNKGFNFKQPKWFKDFDKDDYLGWTKKEFWGQ